MIYFIYLYLFHINLYIMKQYFNWPSFSVYSRVEPVDW